LQIKSIQINNLASFINFDTDSEFQKTNLLFGTNGSGKSTLVRFLCLLNARIVRADDQSKSGIITFLKNHFSKEAKSSSLSATIKYNSKQVHVTYEKDSEELQITGDDWTPIKVFDNVYTEQTVGSSFNLNLRESGITIGKTNRDLETARNALNSLEEQKNATDTKIDSLLIDVVKNFRTISESTMSVEGIITKNILLAETCKLNHDKGLIDERKKLGYGILTRTISTLNESTLKFQFDIDAVNVATLEEVLLPELDSTIENHLRDFTDFFQAGLVKYNLVESSDICPFCLREWVEAPVQIEKYKDFLFSNYSKKRDHIKKMIQKLSEYKSQIQSHSKVLAVSMSQTLAEAKIYDVDLSTWTALDYNQSLHDEIVLQLETKYDNMAKSVSVIEKLQALENRHLDIVISNNALISEVLHKIDSITTLRKQANKKLADHYGWTLWNNYSAVRDSYNNVIGLIDEKKAQIEKLELESTPSDTVKTVFNELLKYIGLGEYYLDNDKRLNLIIDKEYDISDQGTRISSAQKKILSLCYYFAELVSEADDPRQLKDRILIFDDPVDSADYIYFHSIASVLEQAEFLISKILQHDCRFGQFFVFTHNSIFFERLAPRWSDQRKKILKEGGITRLVPADRMINNYAEYVAIICRFYKNPKALKVNRIFLGNVIRRTLEILASFDNLTSNDIQSFLNGMGKPKLALLANHLSHESFSRVLDPLVSEGEIQAACREVLEIIKDRHPKQFETIQDVHAIKFD